MTYLQVVRKAQATERNGYGKVRYEPCEAWLAGDQINLWTYWQGYQLKDVGQKGMDILLVGQDWGAPARSPELIQRIQEIQAGTGQTYYSTGTSPTDRALVQLFRVFGDKVDITGPEPGLRLFFTNYSLGYRVGSETGGMTKRLMRQDAELFDELVLAVRPSIIICLGKLTYEMAAGTKAEGFLRRLREGRPFKAAFPRDPTIPVYGVAHCGARGQRNVGGMEAMRSTWKRIAEEHPDIRPANRTV